MRLWLLLLDLLGVCLGLPSLAAAQEAPLLPPGLESLAPWEITWPKAVPLDSSLPPVQNEVPPSLRRNPRIDVDFLLGVPMAARVGMAVFRHHEQAVLLEAMGGVDYFVVPFLAAGARYRFVAWHTQRGELVIKPGADAYAGVAPFVIGALPLFGIGGDVACVFLYNGPHLGFEWGVDLGAIDLLNSSNNVVPIASFILGFNF